MFEGKLHELVIKHQFVDIYDTLKDLRNKVNDLEVCIDDDFEKREEPQAEDAEASKTDLKTQNLENRIERLEKMHIYVADI